MDIADLLRNLATGEQKTFVTTNINRCRWPPVAGAPVPNKHVLSILKHIHHLYDEIMV